MRGGGPGGEGRQAACRLRPDRFGVDRTAIDAQLDACLTGSAMIPDPAP